MFSSRFFIALLIPVIILGLGLWLVASVNVNTGSVEVAGALVSNNDIEVTVKNASITNDGGTRKLVVDLDVKNPEAAALPFGPSKLQLVLSRASNPAGPISASNIFMPMSYTASGDISNGGPTTVPPGGVRSYSVTYWAETLPEGEEWRDYFIHLEYYDTVSAIMFSKPINPEDM